MGHKKKPKHAAHVTHVPPAPHAKVLPEIATRWTTQEVVILAAVGVIGIGLGVGLWYANQPKPAEVSAPYNTKPVRPLPATAATSADTVQAVPAPPQVMEQLVGKWVRADGGYVLDIQSGDAAGNLVVQYLNPKPIHVARAVATQAGAATKVFVELRDVNYPGSTYDLTFDPVHNQLSGQYFQAVQQQQFEVQFDRQK